jgi:CxxC motif-containing protein
MTKNLVCIECPRSCVLSVDIEGPAVKAVRGAKCPKGASYAAAEVENPSRILTATVLATGLDLKLVPVRTDRPVPKKDVLRAMEEIRGMRITKSIKCGEAVIEDFLGLGVKLVATRSADR